MMAARLKGMALTSLLSFGLTSGVAIAQEYEWTLISPLTPAISYVPLYQEMIDNIEARSDGRIDITLLTAGQHPYKGAEIITAVRDGTVQMGNSSDVYVSSAIPEIAFVGLPFLFDSLDHAKETYNALKEPYFDKIMADGYNSEMLLSFLISGSAIHADTPLDSLDALDGRKIRVFGPESGQMIELMGGTPVTVAFAELYTALQRGTIDGAVTGMVGAKASKVYEVVNHNTWWNWSYALEFILVNKDAISELPSDLQDIVREEAALASEKVQALQDRLPAEILVESLENYGITATGLSQETIASFREVTKPVTTDWLKKTGDQGQMAYKVYQEILAKR